MTNSQFNTRVSPDLKDKYNGFMERYKQDGRIVSKGDFFGICLDDHVEMEKRRIFLEHCIPDIKDGFDYLERLFKLFERIQVNHNNEISLLTRKFNDELLAKEIRINKLEDNLNFLKEQLQEKMIENDDLRKGITQLQKRKKSAAN